MHGAARSGPPRLRDAVADDAPHLRAGGAGAQKRQADRRDEQRRSVSRAPPRHLNGPRALRIALTTWVWSGAGAPDQLPANPRLGAGEARQRRARHLDRDLAGPTLKPTRARRCSAAARIATVSLPARLDRVAYVARRGVSGPGIGENAAMMPTGLARCAPCRSSRNAIALASVSPAGITARLTASLSKKGAMAEVLSVANSTPGNLRARQC